MAPASLAFCLIACITILASAEEVTLRTRLNTDQRYRSDNVKASELYAISVDRMSSSVESETSRCRAVPKSIEITRKT